MLYIVGGSYSHKIATTAMIYFTANDGVHGNELWKSDGTEAGTFMIADINPEGSSYPASFTAVDNTVYFSADDGIHGRELWKTGLAN
jgi:ELWxxDGT repeat protein